MANYEAIARSNYFAVTDEAAFDAYCEKWGFEKITNDKGLVGFLCGAVSDYGGFPSEPTLSWREDHAQLDDDGYVGDYDGPDYQDELVGLLVDGHVAIGMETGHEKMRYVSAFAWAVNSKGEHRSIDIDAIYSQAKDLGDTVMYAMY